jgi:uncharacterized membrane protein YedE/YeeE
MFTQHHHLILFSGLLLGVTLGIVLQRTRLCLVAAVGNFVLMRDYRQIRAWLGATAVAVLGTQWLESGGVVDVASSAYRGGLIDWLGAIAGGVLFGVGSVLAGGCAARTLVRAAGGHAGSLLSLLSIAVGSALAQYGPLMPLRVGLTQTTAFQLTAGDASLATLLHLAPWLLGFVAALLCFGLILWLSRAERDVSTVVGGMFVGTLIVAGWWLTGHALADEFDPLRPVSVAMTGPLARTLMWLGGGIGGWDFGMAVVAGMLLGAGAGGLASREFRWTRAAAGRLRYHLLGGALMGVGATLAGGCNIGQGLTGLSTVSIESVLALAFMLVGIRLGVAWLVVRT